MGVTNYAATVSAYIGACVNHKDTALPVTEISMSFNVLCVEWNLKLSGNRRPKAVSHLCFHHGVAISDTDTHKSWADHDNLKAGTTNAQLTADACLRTLPLLMRRLYRRGLFNVCAVS